MHLALLGIERLLFPGVQEKVWVLMCVFVTSNLYGKVSLIVNKRHMSTL
jgi:hypothetical protein